MFLFCHVILQDHMIERSCDFMGGSLSRQINVLSNLEAIGTVVVEI